MAHVAASLTQPLTALLSLDLDHIEAGVPLSALGAFVQASGVPLKDLHEIVIPSRTLKHRRLRHESLSRDESDKLARLARVFDHTVKVFGDGERARAWLNQPKQRFNDRSPLVMLLTEAGARLVEEMLVQIDDGMFA